MFLNDGKASAGLGTYQPLDHVVGLEPEKLAPDATNNFFLTLRYQYLWVTLISVLARN
jgi:hypothetical protein